ncbi:response receiver-modulated diguanylate cyclase [Citrifermentans bemidjiense Bem]|uniref:diguanylate cyclase n=1 Tax=Citrifermentans bemidjiense (strain ATCC BAA-1014 / DSM 16622 / JCM 12645 / Bem) TaxID=404380 RepID=B5EI87_CITBB|nr:diguanylate cyclase [Citrifermentans bemidjiense]ACH38351.1 response receiver-modulated diguanylate cyclase [Citrifermentans bemidjiense Bem]
MSSCVLVIDDSAAIREQVVRTLKDVGLFEEYCEARDGLEGFKTLIESKADLVICDVDMPRMDGYKFLQLVASRPELLGLPIIMLTGMMDFNSKIRGLEQGASDYLTKPFDSGELVARVKVQLKIKSLQDELKKANEQLKRLTNIDHLTNLFNRRYLTEVLESEFFRARRNRENLSLVIIDIDYFKNVNDTYGHQNGDVVLASVAGLAQKQLRAYDSAARYGGEEFVLVLPGTSLEGGKMVAERLRQAVLEFAFPSPMEDLTLTISAGVATFPSPSIDNIDSLFRQADEALYRAKQTGRNRVELMDV